MLSPSWYPLVAADLSSITTSFGPAGARPWLMVTIGDPSDAGASLKLPPMPGAPPPLPTTLPSRADDVGALVGDVAVGPCHAVQAGQLVDDRGRHRPGVGAGEAAGRGGGRLAPGGR